MLEVKLQIYKIPALTGKLSFIYLFSGKSVGQKELEILKLNNGKGNDERKKLCYMRVCLIYHLKTYDKKTRKKN